LDYAIPKIKHGAAHHSFELKGKGRNKSPQEIVEIPRINKKAFHDLGINFDIYTEQSSELHKENCPRFFQSVGQQRKLYQAKRRSINI